MIQLSTHPFPYFGLFVLLGGWLLLNWWSRLLKKPAVFFSDTSLYARSDASFGLAYDIALFLFIIALLDPHFIQRVNPTIQRVPTEGRAIYLVLDRSGSMAEGDKLDLLKKVTGDFIRQRPNDLIGLIGFARNAEVLSPLTYDHDRLLKVLDQLEIVKNKEQDGTSIGYAIYKSVKLIEATQAFAKVLKEKGEGEYEIKGGQVILVTDGLPSIAPEDVKDRYRSIELEESGRIAQELGVTVSILTIDPRIEMREYSAYRTVMERAALMSGGKLYTGQGAGELGALFSQVDQQALSQYVDKEETLSFSKRVFSLYPYLIFAGVVCLLYGIVEETLFKRRVP